MCSKTCLWMLDEASLKNKCNMISIVSKSFA